MVKQVKIKPRAISRKKTLKKERERYELRRKSKKIVKKQINALFPKKEDNASLEEKQKSLSLLYKTLDSHQSKGLITKGRANRLKSKYTKKLNSLFTPAEDSNLNKD